MVVKIQKDNYRNSGRIEAFAKKTHRLTPFLIEWIYQFFKEEFLDAGGVPISPSTRVKIAIYEKKLKLKNTGSQQNITLDLLSISPPLANKWKLLIPGDHKRLIPINMVRLLKSMKIVRIFISKKKKLPSIRISKEIYSTNKRITTTPCFVCGTYQFWGSGILNQPGFHAGNSFDLSMPNGMAVSIHEIFHVYQFLSNPTKMIWGYLKAMVVSWKNARALYSHRHIPFELEATTLQFELFRILSRPKWKSKLKIFTQLR